MGRNPKVGLDYFPLDTSWDIKMQLVKAKYGLEGVGCIIELFKLIYSEGYFIKWDDDNRLLFASENKIDENKLDEIVDFSCRKGVFHAGKLRESGVLTSAGIQKRWLRVASDSNRSIKELDQSIALIVNRQGFPVPETTFPAQEIKSKNDISGTDNPHIKENKSIEKESIYTSYSPNIPEVSPEETHTVVSVLEPEDERPQGYPELVYNAWVALGEHVYQPASLWMFQSKWGQDIRPKLTGIHSDAILAALANLKSIYEAPPGTYYWDMKIGVQAFFDKHLEKFLPGNFDPADFKKRLTFTEQQEADNAAAFKQVFGKEMGEA